MSSGLNLTLKNENGSLQLLHLSACRTVAANQTSSWKECWQNWMRNVALLIKVILDERLTVASSIVPCISKSNERMTKLTSSSYIFLQSCCHWTKLPEEMAETKAAQVLKNRWISSGHGHMYFGLPVSHWGAMEFLFIHYAILGFFMNSYFRRADGTCLELHGE